MSAALEAQAEEKKNADEMRKEDALKNVRQEYVKCLQYHWLWFDSDCCWKTRREVRRELGKIKTKGGKFEALKTNILIRHLGFGWTECHTQWSKDGSKKSVKQLRK